MIDVATKTSYHPRNKYFYFFSQIVVADKFYLLFPANIAARPWVPALAPSLNNYHRRQIEVQRQLAVQEIMMNRRGQVDRQTRGYMWGWK